MTKTKYFLHSLAASALLSMALPAVSATWNLDSSCGAEAGVYSASCGGGLSVSGWTTNTGATTSGTVFHDAKIYEWNPGLGVKADSESNNDTGPHAIDNRYGTDAILFSFATATNLSSVSIGWNGTDNATGTTSSSYRDSDLSVLAWIGDGAPGSLENVTPNSAGWKLIGNYADVGSLSGNTANLPSAANQKTFSSYWLISAYDSAFYGSTMIGGTADTKLDAFKITTIAGTACTGAQCPSTNVPEPGSLALFGAAALGYVALRRRKDKKEA